MKCESKCRCSKMRFMKIMCFPVFIASYFDQNTKSDENIHTVWMPPPYVVCSMENLRNFFYLYLYFNTLCAWMSLYVWMNATNCMDTLQNQMNILAKLRFSKCHLYAKRAFESVRSKTSNRMRTDIDREKGAFWGYLLLRKWEKIWQMKIHLESPMFYVDFRAYI